MHPSPTPPSVYKMVPFRKLILLGTVGSILLLGGVMSETTENANKYNTSAISHGPDKVNEQQKSVEAKTHLNATHDPFGHERTAWTPKKHSEASARYHRKLPFVQNRAFMTRASKPRRHEYARGVILDERTGGVLESSARSLCEHHESTNQLYDFEPFIRRALSRSSRRRNIGVSKEILASLLRVVQKAKYRERPRSQTPMVQAEHSPTRHQPP